MQLGNASKDSNGSEIAATRYALYGVLTFAYLFIGYASFAAGPIQPAIETLSSVNNDSANNNGDVQSVMQVTVEILDGQVVEGELYSVRVRLSKVSSEDVSFATYTRPGTAINGTDFFGMFERFIIPAGQTELAIPVTVIDDDNAEVDESFSHFLVNSSVPVTKSIAVTTVIDDDMRSSFESMRNRQDKFIQYENVASDDLDLQALTEPVSSPDNGSVGDGQFRIACEYSHFNMDDPIVKPGEPGAAHLHMYFGNTRANGNSSVSSLVDSGGGTCNGFELNRSAYWTPALLDGKGNAVVPDSIIVYYKTKNPATTMRMPQGLKMIAGNTDSSDFEVSQYLHWSCGTSGGAYNFSNRIPQCNGDVINATIAFPQCWDGRNLDSSDHRSHMKLINPQDTCPTSHPVELPQISILLYYPGQSSVEGWYISSDRHMGMNSEPGATLHADWWGGWNNEAMDLWTEGCIRNARNCSFGQTGTARRLARLNGFQVYEGPNFIPLP